MNARVRKRNAKLLHKARTFYYNTNISTVKRDT